MSETGTNNNYKSFPGNIKIPIWLTTAAIIIFILIMAFTVNHARERDIIEHFSQQQVAIARGTAAGIEDLISSVEKSMIILSRLPSCPTCACDNNTMPEVITRQSIKVIYDDLEGTVECIAVKNKDGVVTTDYPPSSSGEIISVRFKNNFYSQETKKTGETYIGDLRVVREGDTENKVHSVIIAVPKYDSEGEFSGTVLAVLSLSALIDRYMKAAGEASGCGWIVDNSGFILLRPDQTCACVELETLGNAKTVDGKFLKDILAKGKEGYSECVLPMEDKGMGKSIIAYAPINAGSERWFVAITIPYNRMILLARKGFINVILWTFGFILVVIIAGILVVYFGVKRVRLKEELKRLKETKVWQEKLLREYRTTEGVITGSPIPTFVLNREHRVILWNKACSELTGFSAEEVIGTDNHSIPFYKSKRPTLADIIIDKDIDVLEKYYIAKGIHKSSTIEGAYEARDYIEDLGGRNRHIYFLAAPIFDGKGEIIAAVETIQDVTQQRETDIRLKKYADTLQNELKENIKLRKEIEGLYNYLQSIVESLPEKIFDLDSEGIITYVSRKEIKKNGKILSQKLGDKQFTDFVEPENRQFVLDIWDNAKKGIFSPYEMTATARDGSKRNLLITLRPVKETGHYILVQRDITELKKLEEKFYESQKLAAVGQLSAGIAHEVRNPLSSIKMSLQILEKRMQPEGNNAARFKIARREVEHLEKLVNDLLLYAKPSEPQRKPSAVENMINAALAMTEKAASDKKIRVGMNIAKDFPLLNVDPVMLEQVFLNIYLNAIDAMEEGGKLSISAKKTDDSTVSIEFKDDGCGISSEDMPHVFNPFFTKKQYGTGLGLTQIKKIVELHQGTVVISSKKGKGTSVVLTFPIDAPQQKGYA